jgi:hypothetical protein
MEHLGQIFSGAPWWVYVLLIYLVSIGIQATKPRVMPIKRVVLLPLFFAAWSFYALYEKLSLGFPSLLIYWVICLALGAYLGMKEVHAWQFQKDRQKGMITIPGNYSTLILILLIFVLKFFWGYFYTTHTQISYGIYLADTATSAFVTGFFVGRAGFFLKAYLKN